MLLCIRSRSAQAGVRAATLKQQSPVADQSRLRAGGLGMVTAFPSSVLGLTYFTFFLPLVPVGVAEGHSCLSAARWVAWRRDIPWVLRVSATESLHRFLGLPLAL